MEVNASYGMSFISSIKVTIQILLQETRLWQQSVFKASMQTPKVEAHKNKGPKEAADHK